MSSRQKRRSRDCQFRHLAQDRFVPFTAKGGATADRFAGATPPVLRHATASAHTSSPRSSQESGPTACTCASPSFPTVPGWPDAIVSKAVIDTASFWRAVLYPCVFRLVSVAGMTPEDAALIDAGYFIFLVHPEREDADMQALADLLRAQGGTLPGDPIDIGGDGRTIMQLVAVLVDETKRPSLIALTDATASKAGPTGE